ncbi:UNVERIFIED_CONTAM: PH, RCC1 and FYVE domains-containing protein 1 [Sesamum radiatum]|uniref:PH, RCC1 and FYVE domains-containing protein 1 n=1 Tax=Sesamum radiatum TaxID=300843 RepID=A0AAW2QEW0_SESRA
MADLASYGNPDRDVEQMFGSLCAAKLVGMELGFRIRGVEVKSPQVGTALVVDNREVVIYNNLKIVTLNDYVFSVSLLKLQALIALKKGTQLLKYCRKGRPNFRTFRLSSDETTLIWYSKGSERHLKLSAVSRIIPGQRTPVFKRFLRPDKEYLSFSLIYNDGERSLDLICKDKTETEIWLTGLQALISARQAYTKRTRSEISDFRLRHELDSPLAIRLLSCSTTDRLQMIERHFLHVTLAFVVIGKRKIFLGIECFNKEQPLNFWTLETIFKAFPKILLSFSCTALLLHYDLLRLHGCGDTSQDYHPFGARLELSSSIRSRVSTDSLRDNYWNSSSSHAGSECASMQIRTSGADGFRISISSTPSCSSTGSGTDDIESLGDLYAWGEILSDGLTDGTGKPIPVKTDVFSPKLLESNVVLDVHQIACGVRHIALVTRQGDVFTWGEECGGRLGHGVEKDFSCPRLVEFFAVTSVDCVACGEFHTCAVSASGDLYTWGDGTHNAGLLGHGNNVSHWIPKRVCGSLEGLHVLSVACGTWHTALTTSTGQLFTFGDGTFGALGHGDRESIPYPKEVESLSGLKTAAVSCGVWHTAAIIEVTNQLGPNISSRKLFTWGDGDKNRLGHGSSGMFFYPTCVSGLIDYNIQQWEVMYMVS